MTLLPDRVTGRGNPKGAFNDRGRHSYIVKGVFEYDHLTRLHSHGKDRPGLVDALSKALTAHQGKWLESRIAALGGRFDGILLVSVPETEARALKEALASLECEGLRRAAYEPRRGPGAGHL